MGMPIVLKDGTVLRGGAMQYRHGRKKKGGALRFALGAFWFLWEMAKGLVVLGLILVVLLSFFVAGPIGVILMAGMVLMLNWMLKEIT